MCRFYVQSGSNEVLQLGANLLLEASDGPPYQDPDGDNFAPIDFTNSTTCDSYIGGLGGRNGVVQFNSFISWPEGSVSPRVIHAVWVLTENIPPNQKVLVMQIAFSGAQAVLKGQMVVVGSTAYTRTVQCGPGAVPQVITTPPADAPAVVVPVFSSDNTAAIVLGVLFGASILVLIAVLLCVWNSKKPRKKRGFEELDPQIQDDFMAVAKAALRENEYL